jgi:hypothetical protein
MALQSGTSNRTAIRVVRETVFGTTPATPVLSNIRYTGESLKRNIRNVTSDEIRSDRMTADLLQVGGDVSGDINVEFSYDSYDEFLQGALCGAWVDNLDGTWTLKNGVSLLSWTIQKHFQDLAIPQFQNMVGCRVGGMAMECTVGQIVKGSFSFMGLTATMGPTQIAGATFASPGDGLVPFTAAANVGGVEKDGVPMAVGIRAFNMTLSNSLRGQEVIGSLGLAGIALGKLDITGDNEFYFENADEYNAFLAADDFKLQFDLTSDIGDKYTFVYPRIKYEDGEILAGGLDQDLAVKGKWRALYDSVSDSMIQIIKTPAP